MKLVLQRVISAEVWVKGQLFSSIQEGLLVFLGIEDADKKEDVEQIIKKIINLRIFPNEKAQMDKSVLDISGEVLLVSQFTLLADTKKGNRPSFIRAAKPEKALPIYENMIVQMKEILGDRVKTGQFGADMHLKLINDGPVTIILDSKA